MSSYTKESSPQAQFAARTACITCGSDRLTELDGGRFHDAPLRGFLESEPFGEDPLPALAEAEWRFVACDECGQKFHQNILEDAWLGVYYDRWITSEAIEAHARKIGQDGFDHAFGKGKHAVERILQLERLTREIRGDDPVRVLDFGCGEGQFLQTCTSFGFDCVGVEFSAAREQKKRIDFFSTIDEVEAEYPLGHFHAVVLFEVLEHLAHPLAILQALRPLMAEGGVLILETPNCAEVTGLKTMRDYRLIDPLGHINGFTPETQERIAKEAGFKRITPSTVQCTADVTQAYKREAKRLLSPFLKRYTQQYFVTA